MSNVLAHLKAITGCDEVLLSGYDIIGYPQFTLRFGDRYMKLKLSLYDVMKFGYFDEKVKNKILMEVTEFFLLNNNELSTDSKSP